MADIISYRTIDEAGGEPSLYSFKYKRWPDGTYAEVIATAAISTGGASFTIVAHTNVAVNGNTNIIAEKASRKYLLIVNDSDTPVYLVFGGIATVPAGIRLNANGGSYEMSQQQGNLYTGPINANHGGGAVDKVLLLTEGS